LRVIDASKAQPCSFSTTTGASILARGCGAGPDHPKGRQVDPTALAEVQGLLGDRERRRDLLIEHLHLLQRSGVGLI
jgi:hypothetical protein